MRASELSFQSYMSKRILSFADSICSSVCGPKALKSRVCVLPYSVTVKKYETFEICEVFAQTPLSLNKYLERKIRRHPFCSLCANLPTVKIWGQSDKFPMSFSSLESASSEKKWFEKTVLHVHMSIRRVIFTSGQNLNRYFSANT